MQDDIISPAKTWCAKRIFRLSGVGIFRLSGQEGKINGGKILWRSYGDVTCGENGAIDPAPSSTFILRHLISSRRPPSIVIAIVATTIRAARRPPPPTNN
jgi:hypothetical protein